MVATNMARESTVLVIDDDESMREGCRQILEAEGYVARVAKDGRQGLNMVERLKPSVVLVDLRMPAMDGMEALKRIRETSPQIISIVITGYGTIDSEVEAMKLGARDYIRKPFDDRRLLTAIRLGLETRTSWKKRARGKARPEPRRDKQVIIEALERAARECPFMARLTDEGSKALAEYDLSSEARAALMSGDIRWIENRVGKLNDRQKTWLSCRLEQEKW